MVDTCKSVILLLLAISELFVIFVSLRKNRLFFKYIYVCPRRLVVTLAFSRNVIKTSTYYTILKSLGPGQYNKTFSFSFEDFFTRVNMDLLHRVILYVIYSQYMKKLYISIASITIKLLVRILLLGI